MARGMRKGIEVSSGNEKVAAKRLEDILEVKGMRPVDLSIRSGVSKASISQYIHGTSTPGNISAQKMADVLNVSPMWLMGFDVPMNKEAKPVLVLKEDSALDPHRSAREKIAKWLVEALPEEEYKKMEYVTENFGENIARRLVIQLAKDIFKRKEGRED